MTDARAGQLSCACPPFVDAATDVGAARGAYALASGFGLSVIVQSLALAALPVAAVALAPTPSWRGLPMIAWWTGMMLATLPASVLRGAFGLRSAVGVGGALGLAGGLLAGFGFDAGQFAALALGAFWLGLAQGFAQFYRHLAAGADRLRSFVAAGTLALLLAPLVAQAATWQTRFLPPAALFGAAGAVSLISVLPALALPAQRWGDDGDAPIAWRRLFMLTLPAGLAWAVMTAAMGRMPLMLLGCGVGLAATPGFMGLHTLTMYLPAAFVARRGRLAGSPLLLIGGLACLATAVVLLRVAATPERVAALAIVAGCGWSLTTFGALMRLHRDGSPGRAQIVAHDMAVFACALIGSQLAA